MATQSVPKKGKKTAKKKKGESKKISKKAKSEIDKYVDNLDVYTCDVTEGNEFYCTNGDSFKSVIELGDSMDSMDEETFGHHVNEDKNDFATWIYDCVGDVELADALRMLDNLEDTRNEIRVRIEVLGGK